MPDPSKFKDKNSFMKSCIPEAMDEPDTKNQDHAIAKCNGIWEQHKKKSGENIMSKGVERRFLPGATAEIRLKREKDKPTKIVGYFAKFNSLSDNLGGFREIIQKGFFKEALKKSDTVDLFNHNPDYILGRKSAGTLRLWEDDTGLAYECDAPDTQLIRDMVLTPIERGDIKGNSFGFTIRSNGDAWDEDDGGRVTRTLVAGGCRDLVDGSQVVSPAYPDTSLALRSMDKWKEEKEKPAFELVKEPEEVKEPVEERELTTDEIKTIVSEVIDKVAALKVKVVNEESESEPMQADSKKEGENSKPMQGDDEVRKFFK